MMNDDYLLYVLVIFDIVININFDFFRFFFKQLLKIRSVSDNKECLECI